MNSELSGLCWSDPETTEERREWGVALIESCDATAQTEQELGARYEEPDDLWGEEIERAERKLTGDLPVRDHRTYLP